MWLNLVERYVRDVEVVGSNPVISTIKTKSGNTRCSLAFFFVLYGFVDSRKINQIEKVTVHPITFTAANRRQNRRRRDYSQKSNF